MKFLSILFVVLGLGSWALADVPPSFDSAKWSQLINHITHDGTVMQSQAGIYMVLSSITSTDATQPHIANYISTVGWNNVDGIYEVDHLESVWENWQKDSDGNWQISQWIYILTPAGDLYSAQNYHIVEGANGSVISYQFLQTSAETNMQQWNDQLNSWLATLPQ